MQQKARELPSGPSIAVRLCVSCLIFGIGSAHVAAQQSDGAPMGTDDARDEQAGARQASRLSDVPIPLALEGFPRRPKPLLELGPPFLGTGPIGDGARVPGGAVWQPSFVLFGTFQTSLGATDNGTVRTSRWANRLDVFGNLYFSQTERLVFGLRPFDETNAQGGRSFSGYTSFSPDPLDLSGGNNHFNLDSDTVSHLFFEGDFGELFPSLDDNDRRALDLGFSFGRQPISFQEGLLINDSIDAIGLTRNNLKLGRTVNYRITGLLAWNEINRNTESTHNLTRNAEAESARLIGIFNEIDWRASTVSLDVVYVAGGMFRGTGTAGEAVEIEAAAALYVGAGFVQRFGSVNTAFRVTGSMPAGDEMPAENPLGIGNSAAAGWLVFVETSWTPRGSHNLSYVNAFFAVDDYRAAALDPNVPGPLARAGILFAGSALGDPAAISSQASDAAGVALGHQWFFAGTRQQLVLEAGVRYSTFDCAGSTVCPPHTWAGGARYQLAFGRRGVLVLDGYVAYDRAQGVTAGSAETSSKRIGARVELVTKF